MNIELSQKEQTVLAEALESSLFSLSDEISHTEPTSIVNSWKSAATF
jgi:hypothetical protein